ncbi:MAG: TSUP family transporter, partial [Geminicoccaceae bacterium]
TATGVGGPPLALLYQHRPPATLRATIAFCFLVGELVSLALLAASGRLGMEAVQSAAVLLPAVLVGSSASQLVHGHIGQRQLRTGVLLFSLVSGVVLIAVR